MQESSDEEDETVVQNLIRLAELNATMKEEVIKNLYKKTKILTSDGTSLVLKNKKAIKGWHAQNSQLKQKF